MKYVADKIRDLREANKLSQREIGTLIGTTQQVYSKYELGDNDLPLRHLITLCKFYGISADEMLGIKPDEVYKL